MSADTRCGLTVSVSTAECSLPRPCPLHDHSRPTQLRTVLESLRYTIERIAATLIALSIAKHWL